MLYRNLLLATIVLTALTNLSTAQPPPTGEPKDPPTPKIEFREAFRRDGKISIRVYLEYYDAALVEVWMQHNVARSDGDKMKYLSFTVAKPKSEKAGGTFKFNIPDDRRASRVAYLVKVQQVNARFSELGGQVDLPDTQDNPFGDW